MKPCQLLFFWSLLAYSSWGVADQQSLNADLTQATTPHISFEDQLLSSDAAANVRSVVLRHIANVTALLTEEYLKGLVTSGLDAFGTNGSASLLKSQDDTTGKPSDKNSVTAPEEVRPPQPSANASDFNLPTGDNAATRLVGLLPPSWPSLSIKPLVPASCPCNCNNPKTPCCIKLCVHSKLRTDQQPVSTAEAEQFDQVQAKVPKAETEFDTKEIVEPQMLASCPCNCNNPTTTCCIKLCVNRMKAQLDQQVLTSAVVSPEPHQAQEALSNTEDFAPSQANGADAGMVTLKASLGSDLTVKAESDLALYASFVSQTLVHDLGLTAEVHALAGNETSTVVIKDETYQVVGTVPIAVEAYTRKNFAFEDWFYVIEPSQEAGGKAAPELVFGIDHVRQAEGLALRANFFI